MTLSYIAILLTAFSTLSNPKTEWLADYYAGYNWDNFCKLTAANEFVDIEHPDYNILNAAIFHATNKQRAKKGLPVLVFHPKLRISAFNHCSEMYMKNYFDHDDSTGNSFSARIWHEEPNFTIVGENLAKIGPLSISSGQTYTYQKVGDKYKYFQHNRKVNPETYLSFAQKVVDAWMASPGHRDNIMAKDYTHMGVSVLIPPNPYGSEDIPKALITQDFGSYKQ